MACLPCYTLARTGTNVTGQEVDLVVTSHVFLCLAFGFALARRSEKCSRKQWLQLHCGREGDGFVTLNTQNYSSQWTRPDPQLILLRTAASEITDNVFSLLMTAASPRWCRLPLLSFHDSSMPSAFRAHFDSSRTQLMRNL